MRKLFLILALAGVASAQRVPVRDFVSRMYIHGFPIESAPRYSSSVPELLKMLDEEGLAERTRGNVVITLGLTAGSEIAPKFIEILNFQLKSGRSDNVASTVFALGYLVNRTKSKQALSYLISSTDERFWLSRNNPVALPPDEVGHLVRLSILALGLTGDKVAEHYLQKLLFEEGSGPNKDVIETALDANRKIARLGLLGYYREETR